MSLFRGFTDILHEDTKELSWRMSINISHIILESHAESDSIDQSPHSWKQHKVPKKYDDNEPVFRDACSTICTTGDRLGEFWTCSFLGPFWAPEEDLNKTNQSPTQYGSIPQGQPQQMHNDRTLRAKTE
jgi:hypothetical protein